MSGKALRGLGSDPGDREANRAPPDSLEQLAHARAIIEVALDCIISIDGEGKITEFNPAAERTFGFSKAEAIGCDMADLIIPLSRRAPHREGFRSYLATGNGRVIGRRVEMTALRADGSEFPVELAVTRLPGDAPTFTAYLRDISERKTADEHRRYLLNELNHRVKNILANAQAIAAFSLSDEHATVRDAFIARLHALAGAHQLLAKANWEATPLHELLTHTLKPFGLAEDPKGRIRIAGPPILVSPKTAQAFAMALHELTTNASKYGALANDSGSIDITWAYERSAAHPFSFFWEEQGGPPVKQPTRRGFGSRVICEMLAAEIEGEVAINYRASGVLCVIKGRV